MPTAAFRLPGVYFLPAPRPQTVELPPLDVSGFVGFATRGPLNVPVPVGDLSSCDAIFGGPFAVARDSAGKPVNAYLRDAVAGFFAAGGARCYVARVAGGNATPARFAVPGMLAIDSLGQTGRATIEASSPGTWGDALQIGTIQTATLLPPNAFTVNPDGTLTWSTQGQPQAVQQGDVLRLTFDGDAGRQWLFPVDALTQSDQDTPEAMLYAASVWSAVATLPPALQQPIEAVQRVGIDGPAALSVGATFLTSTSGISLSLTGRDRLNVSIDDVLLLTLADHSLHALSVTDVQARAPSGSLPEASVVIVATALVCIASARGRPQNMPAGPARSLIRVEQLGLTLRVKYLNQTTRELASLGFNSGHARFWGDIAVAESGSLAGGAASSSGAAQAQQSGVLEPGDATTLYADLFGDTRVDLDWTDPRLTTVVSTLLAPAAAAPTYLPVGMAVFGSDDDLASADSGVPANDQLAQFDGQLFLDPTLFAAVTNSSVSASVDPASMAIPAGTLLATATDLYFVQDVRLKGMHSLMFIDEVALIAVPDAIQSGWGEGLTITPTAPPAVPVPPMVAPGGFADCVTPPSLLAVDPTGGPMAGGVPITITGSALMSNGAVSVSFGTQAASSVVVANDTTVTCLSPPALVPGPVSVTVTNNAGSASLASAFLYWQSSSAPLLPLANPPGDADPNWLQLVHVALIGLCEARADAVAILALPLTFETQDCINWLQTLRHNLGLPRHGRSFSQATDIADLSYAAVYHPWLLVLDPNGPAGTLRATPPEGAMCGTIAARELAAQTWIAPANVPLPGILDLQPAFSDDDQADLFALGFNLVRREPTDFRVMSAHTLADDQSLLQISVRRLLIQLRKAVLQRGQDYVFERSDSAFRQRVQHGLENILRLMFDGGAFAGQSQQSSYRVVVDDSVNPPTSVDAGQMIAQILVAPSQPMEFITVLLTRVDQGQLQAAEA